MTRFNMRMAVGICVAALVCAAQRAPAQDSTTTSIYSISVEPMKGASKDLQSSLAPYKGQVLLIVNVASKCGFTPQYKELEAVHRKYKDQGLRVLAFPCNDFGGQEPGTEEEIVKFCQSKFDVTFPLYAKLHTKGTEQSPLYKFLTTGLPGSTGDVKWNFEKFLVSRDGKIVARFPSKVKPDAPELTSAIEKELAAKSQ
jgi:glutathione peroxidase